MFEGQHETNIDSKGRVGLVQRYREHFKEEVVVLRWKDHMRIFTPQKFENLAGYVAKQLSFDSEEGVRNFFNPKLQRDRRFFFGNKFEMSFDAQGRLTIPKMLRDSLDLYDEVVWNGCRDYLELWAKKHYEADRAQWEQAGGFDKLFASVAPASGDPLAQDDGSGSDGEDRDE